MKFKTLLFIGTILTFAGNVYSQTPVWIPANNTTGISYYNTQPTNIGIGTLPNPSYKLYVNGNTGISGAVSITSNLTVGGTSTLKSLLVSDGVLNLAIFKASGSHFPSSMIRFCTYSDYKWDVGAHGINNGFLIYDRNAEKYRLFIDENGNVGIGTVTPTNLLTVDGTIRAEEVLINAIGADFVFEDGYTRPSLVEVEQYVKENKHLPGIASAAEMQNNGVSVGELNMQLLQKVEELTLYMIEQNKKIETLEQELAKLNK